MQLHEHTGMYELGGWDTSGWINSSSATGPDAPSMNAHLTNVRHMDENAQWPERLNLTAEENAESFRKTYEIKSSGSFFRRLWHLLDKNVNKTLSDIQYLDVPDHETVEEFLRERGEWSVTNAFWQTTEGVFDPAENPKLFQVQIQEGFSSRLIVTFQSDAGRPRGFLKTSLNPKEMEALLAVLNKSCGLTWEEIAQVVVPFQG